jgi:hypothetical protein
MASIVSNWNRGSNSESPAPILQGVTQAPQLCSQADALARRSTGAIGCAESLGIGGSQYVDGKKLASQGHRRAPDSEKGEQAVEHCGPRVMRRTRLFLDLSI